jgi:hypothetical protein
MKRRTPIASFSVFGAGLAALITVGSACSSAPDEGATSASDIVSGVHADATPAWRHSWDQPMAGAQVSDVAASFDGADAHFALMIRQGEVLHRYSHGGSWHDDLLGGGGPFTGLAAAKRPGIADYYVTARMPNGHTAVRYASAGTWNAAWIDIGGVTNFKPAVAAPNTAHVFVIGTDGTLYEHTGSFGDESSWSLYSWKPMPALPSGVGIAAAPSAVVRSGTSHVDVAVVDTDGTLWHFNYVGSQGGTWERVPVLDTFHGDVTLASSAANTLDVVALGRDHTLKHYTYDGASWHAAGIAAPCSPAYQGSVLSGPTPMSLTSSADGVEDLYVVNDSGGLFHNTYAAGNSTTPVGAQVCGTCNVAGDSCCASSATFCHNGLACSGGKCQARACGTEFAPACTTGRKCAPGLTVDGAGTCQTCGGLNARCCAEDFIRCQRGVCGHDASINVDYCAHCGHRGEAICPKEQGAACTDGSVADWGQNKCVHCGDRNELACPIFGHECNEDMYVNRTVAVSNGYCVHCGNRDDLTPCFDRPGGYKDFCNPPLVFNRDLGCIDYSPPPPPPPPPPGASNDPTYCGQTGQVCCKHQKACVSDAFGSVCHQSASDHQFYCTYPPRAGEQSGCPGNAAPKQVSLCAKCGLVDYALTGLFCSDDDAKTFADALYPGCSIDPGGAQSVCPR